jgi:hypothetical protein
MPPVRPIPKLKLTQVRVLDVLSKLKQPRHGCIPRRMVAKRAGFAPGTGTLHNILHGAPVGHKYRKPYPGLLDLRLVEEVPIRRDIGWPIEICYRNTALGQQVIAQYLKEHGPLPPVKPPDQTTNKRYREPEE